MNTKRLMFYIAVTLAAIGAIFVFSPQNPTDVMTKPSQELRSEQSENGDAVVAVVNEIEITRQQLDEYRVIQQYSYDLAVAAYESAKQTDDYQASPETYDAVYTKTIASIAEKTMRDLVDDLMKSALLDRKVAEAGIEPDIAQAARDFAPTKDALYADKEFGERFAAHAQTLDMTLEEYIDDLAIPNLARENARAQYAQSQGIFTAEELSQFKERLLDDARVEYYISDAELEEKAIS